MAEETKPDSLAINMMHEPSGDSQNFSATPPQPRVVLVQKIALDETRTATPPEPRIVAPQPQPPQPNTSADNVKK
jgi:hypothetical protein